MLILQSLGVQGLGFALSCLVDFKGFRLSCHSLIQGINDKTLVYGSKDGGQSVYTSDKTLNEIMAVAAAKLNLAEHTVGNPKNGQKRMSFCVDLEGHAVKTKQGKKYYLLDLARVMPPDYLPKVDAHSALFFNLFRPEFVINWHKALSSDAGSTFQTDHDEAKTLNMEARKASSFLRTTLVKKFAEFLVSHFYSIMRRQGLSSTQMPQNILSLLSACHAHGINYRYLGLVRADILRTDDSDTIHVTAVTKTLSSYILTELVARACKEHISQQFITILESTAKPSNKPFITTIISYCNMMLGKGKVDKTIEFWTSENPFMGDTLVPIKHMLRTKFINSLLASEIKEDVRSLISIRVCIYRLMELLGVEMSPHVTAQLMEDPYQVTFFESDIIGIHPKVKHMNFVHTANAKIALLNSRDREKSFLEKRRLLLVAASEYQRAWDASVFKVASIALELGEVYTQLAKIEMFRNSTRESNADPRNHLASAFVWSFTGIAIAVDPKMKALGELTKLYTESMSNTGVETTKDEQVLKVIETDPDITKTIISLLEEDMYLAVNVAISQKTSAPLRTVIHYLTNFCTRIESLFNAENPMYKFHRANLACYDAVFNNKESMDEVAKLYEEALAASSGPGALHDFVVSSSAPVIHLTTVSKHSEIMKKAVNLHFKDTSKPSEIYHFDLFEPSNDMLTWSSGSRWRAYWPAKKKAVFLYICRCSDAKGKIEATAKFLPTTKCKYELRPAAFFSQKHQLVVAFKWPGKGWRDATCLSALMDGLSKTRLDVPAWHLLKCILSVWSQYCNNEALRAKSNFMNPIDPSATILVNSKERFKYVSAPILNLLQTIEQQSNALKIELLSLIQAPECRKHKFHREKSGLWSIGFILYKIYTGEYPFADLRASPELLYIRQYNGPGPDLNWIRKTRANSPLVVYLLEGCLKHETTERESLSQIKAKLEYYKEYESQKITDDLNTFVRFKLGVLIDACIAQGNDKPATSWYTGRVEAFKGKDIMVNFLTGEKKWYNLQTDASFLRGFTETRLQTDIKNYTLSREDEAKLASFPRYVNQIPSCMPEESDTTTDTSTSSMYIMRPTTTTVKTEGAIETVLLTPEPVHNPSYGLNNYMMTGRK
eukprot:TRINITY_DN7561_c0_g1_i2.p1 TRINITY_DN7561_c0_g1~~TRINITY_DN7561_c0_g1_i2.p1  ORF type:complete len:1118 (+),score=152.02 TRINITY_DN7561_c0_g1_i2:2247-5600(+)